MCDGSYTIKPIKQKQMVWALLRQSNVRPGFKSHSGLHLSGLPLYYISIVSRKNARITHLKSLFQPTVEIDDFHVSISYMYRSVLIIIVLCMSKLSSHDIAAAILVSETNLSRMNPLFFCANSMFYQGKNNLSSGLSIFISTIKISEVLRFFYLRLMASAIYFKKFMELKIK